MPARCTSRARRTTTAVALLLTLTASLTACGNDAADTPAAAQHTAANGDVYNDADATFASEMIRHHADALVMVDMTQGRDLSTELAQLTEDIRAAQAPEIEQMADWLTAWGEEVPETSRDHVNSHMGSDGDDTDGMDMEEGMGMDPDDLSALDDAEGSAFETMWLEMMIEHHTGAIEMAKAEQQDGTFADALTLAESIETSQSAEIELMQGMLTG